MPYTDAQITEAAKRLARSDDYLPTADFPQLAPFIQAEFVRVASDGGVWAVAFLADYEARIRQAIEALG